MKLIDNIKNDLKQAMLSKEQLKVSTLRLLLSFIHNREIGKGEELDEEEVTQVLNTELKKRREAALEYKKGERPELAKKEEEELEILLEYQSEQLSDDELEEMAQAAINETQAAEKKDLGKVMQNLMPKVKGKADGGRVNQLVIRLLDAEKN